MQQHQASWSAALPPGVVAQTWRYGFATKVAVAWSEDAPARIAQALREPFVTALRIAAPAGSDDDDDDDALDERDQAEED